jgi:flagellar protein FliJ
MPAKFHFGLQPLLDLRKRIEEAKQEAFATKRREVDRHSHEVERLSAALACAAKGSRSPALPAYLDAAIGAQRRRVGELEAALEVARQELIGASRERRVIEKLCERRRREFEELRARREERELEEANRSIALRLRSG